VAVISLAALVAALLLVPVVGAQEAPGPSTPPPSTSPEPTASTTVPGPAPSVPETTDPGPTTTTSPDAGPADTVLPGVVRVPEGTPEDPPAPRPVPRDQLIPPPIDLASLDAIVAGRRAVAVEAARTAADLANAEALAPVTARASALAAVQAEAPPLDAAVSAARAAERAAAVAVEESRSRFGDLAAESYTTALSGGNAVINSTTEVLMDMDGFGDFVASTEYSGAAWRSVARELGSVRERLAEAEEATRVAIDARTELEGRIGAARAQLDEATAAAQDVAARGEAAVAAAAEMGQDMSFDGLGPTILGATIIGAEDLAAFSAQRGGAAPSIDLAALARHFVAEGAAEGVRADIAWAQSILETGNFGYRGSMVSPSDHNYAGIGACDSCSSGFGYASPQMGARAQMQLLHTYADDNLTAATLANPPVGRAPERSSVRGCCDTWMELSGVWATGAGYGVKILTLYNEMLAFAAARQRAGGQGAATPGA
jgi:hypothetical protein